MKRFLKSYLVFTSWIYRIVMFLIMPIVVIAVVLYIGGAFGNFSSYRGAPGATVCIVVMLLLPMVEIISDNWMFGGIQSKDVEQLDYLKTSGVGMRVLRRALSLDLLRKFLSVVVIVGVSYYVLYLKSMQDIELLQIIGRNPEVCADFTLAQSVRRELIRELTRNDWKLLLYAVLASYFFSVLGTVLARYGSMLWLNVMIAYVFEILIAVCIFTTNVEYVTASCLLAAILDVAVSILAVRIAMKKVEGNYDDK